MTTVTQSSIVTRYYVDQALMKVLGHPKPTTVDDRIDEESPTDSSSMWITKATIRGLHTLADRIQDRIDNLQAAIVDIIDEATQAITDLFMELYCPNIYKPKNHRHSWWRALPF